MKTPVCPQSRYIFGKQITKTLDLKLDWHGPKFSLIYTYAQVKHKTVQLTKHSGSYKSLRRLPVQLANHDHSLGRRDTV
ncbi:predicted protein [Botrytis cinerea T4]|uniref:Uncharacterized protein n=1 Tax=Botryotinia fuckeliana (strain T4) TaxID=999810 RepID=G2YRJ6_BOTF4|nr:predicted protein [Botrytis cinerea T4]